MTVMIPLLTTEEIEGIGLLANAPGRLAKSWAQLTRVVRERLDPAHLPKRRGRTRLYRDGSHYLTLSAEASGELAIEFGRLDPSESRLRVGRMDARWDELGLTGPYAITLRGREHTLNTFAAVLEHYLTLPELS